MTSTQFVAFDNSPKRLEGIERFFVAIKNGQKINEITIDANRLDVIIRKSVWERIGEEELKGLQKAIENEVFQQLHEGHRRNSN